ncbi:unnamed protein product [Toxocara canis]|uniref:Exocyst complex component Sec10 n=1 Tax=Toxocara canis TaxID=6265 RepID=A0A183V866_TOXCA|nr:unnamed protein product [Toxocara canis]
MFDGRFYKLGRLDELSEKQRNEGKRVVLERPRHWAAVFRQILTEQAKHGKCGDYDAVAAVIRRQLDGPLDCDASISKMTNEEDDHHEELLALSKHFTSLRNKEARFQREVTDLFNSDDLLKKAHDCIVEGNILDAYEKLIQAESARFHLLSEVSKHNETHVVQKMINQNAALLEEGFNDFVKSAMYICARCVDVMRNKDSEPRRQLENLLKIIEIDHRIDEQYESLKVSCKQRPRCWRKKFFAVIEQRVQERIEVFHVEKKSSNENWIARYLEICRMFIVEDLFAAKHFLRIFPRKHQLYDRFVFFYHKGISNKLCEMVTNELDRREIVQLLNWIRIYPYVLLTLCTLLSYRFYLN